jgi:hypothetical protein
LRHTWQQLIIVRRVTATTSTRIHIVSRGGDIDNASAAATNVDDKASGTSARHFHIALRIGNDDYNNYRQQRTTSVERQCLVREVWWRRRQRSQAH